MMMIIRLEQAAIEILQWKGLNRSCPPTTYSSVNAFKFVRWSWIGASTGFAEPTPTGWLHLRSFDCRSAHRWAMADGVVFQSLVALSARHVRASG